MQNSDIGLIKVRGLLTSTFTRLHTKCCGAGKAAETVQDTKQAYARVYSNEVYYLGT
jgi:hypothetical protein